MGLLDQVSVVVAVVLAMAAAVMSSGPQVLQGIADYSVEALSPQSADLGDDPGAFLGIVDHPDWLPRRETVALTAHQD